MMSDKLVESKLNKNTSLGIRNKAIEEYKTAFLSSLEMREDFSRKSGYVRDKKPDEQAFHQVKKTFGEFRPYDRKSMELNTNGGKGVDVVMPDGKKVHIANQANLYDKVVQFNKERGDFYDPEKIARLNPADYRRFQKVNSNLEAAREDVLSSFDKRGFAIKRLSAIESEARAEQQATKKQKTRLRPSDQPKISNPSVANNNTTTRTIKNNLSTKEPQTQMNLLDKKSTEAKNSNIKVSSPVNQSSLEFKSVPISKFAMDPDAPLDWIKVQNEKTLSHMRHMLVLSVLQDNKFSVERDHFYNEVHKRIGKPVASVEEAEQYIAKLMSSRNSDALLRDTAPGAVAEAKKYINSFDMDKTFTHAGYPLESVTPEFRERMQITQAYANRIGGDEGNRSFIKTLSEHKDSFIKGMGDPRVGLAVSGSMLTMSVMAGAGPAGVIIGSLKFAHNLLETDKGKQFQQALHSSSVNFLKKLGVKQETLDNISSSVSNIWEKTNGSKWGKVAKYCAAACVVVAFAPTATENLINATHASVIEPTSIIRSSVDIGFQYGDGLSDGSTLSAPQTSISSHPSSVSSSDLLTNTDSMIRSSVDIGEQYGNALSDAATSLTTETPYDIKQGDSLWEIAKETYTSQHSGEMPNQIQLINMVNEIADYNEIDNPNMIYSGQTIFIPNDISPSQDLVSGPTQWLKEQGDSLINRLEGLNDRSLEWRKDHQFDSQIDNARTIRV